MATFHARGAGGAEFEFDELDPTTQRGELLAGQIHKGDLVVLDKKGGEALKQEKVDAMLEPFGLSGGGSVTGDPVIEGPGPAVPIDGADLDRPQLGDAIPIGDALTPDDEEAVPDGSVDDVIDWVRGAPAGDDPVDGWEDRAQRALDVEFAGKGRKGIVGKLEEILAAAAEPDAD